MSKNIQLKDIFDNNLSFFTQWDMGQKIVVEGLEVGDLLPAFYFCNEKSKESLMVIPTRVGDALEVKVPNIILQQAYLLQVHTYISKNTDEGKTLYQWRLPVRPRPKPVEYTYVENTNLLTTIYGLMKSVVVFSPTQPEGRWNLWLQDMGEVPDYIPPEPDEGTVIIDTASLDTPGDYIAEYNDGEPSETITNMTDDQEAATDNDLIVDEH